MPRNFCRKTKYDHAAAPSSQVSCRGWSVARSAATPSRAHRRKQLPARSITTNALARIAGENWAALFAITAASSGRIAATLKAGTPVIVEGKIKPETYTADGVEHKTFSIKADYIRKIDYSAPNEASASKAAKPAKKKAK